MKARCKGFTLLELITAMLLTVLLGVGLAGCSSSDKTAANPSIFDAAPWQGEESYTYNLRRRGEESAGVCTLTTAAADVSKREVPSVAIWTEF